MQSDEDIDIYDVADWLWSFKWLALAFLVMGLAGSTYMWSTSDSRRGVEITLTVFSGGNVLRTEEQIAEILASKAIEKGANLRSSRAESPVILTAIDSRSAQTVLTEVAEIEGLLLDQTRAWVDEITPLINENPAAFESYAIARSFLNGSDFGLVRLITAENQEMQLSAPMGRNLLPLVVAAGLFLLTAMGVSFAKNWRSHRSAL